jgi:hypothetical protein
VQALDARRNNRTRESLTILHAAYGNRRPHRSYPHGVPVTAEQVSALARTLPRSSEALVRGRVKFRIGSIVYLALAADGSTMGFGFPKEWRQVQVEAEPEKFSLPGESDMRFNWLHVRLAAIGAEEMRELVEGAWAMCVPRSVAAQYAAAQRQHA